MQRHVELRIEPVGPRVERHGVFVPALEIAYVAERGIGVGQIRGERDCPLRGRLRLVEASQPGKDESERDMALRLGVVRFDRLVRQFQRPRQVVGRRIVPLVGVFGEG